MAILQWEESEASDPFAALAGDDREYFVRVCTVTGMTEGEWTSVFTTFLEPVLTAASIVEHEAADRLVFEIDVVYSMMTCVVTDEVRTRDEREVFKLILEDWDAESADLPENEIQQVWGMILERFRVVLLSALESVQLRVLRESLSGRGFSFWFAQYAEHAGWEGLTQLEPA